jgi:Transposase IS116/IS110/IS902 family
VAERVPAPAIPKRLEGDRPLMGHDDRRLTGVDLPLVQTAQAHEAPTFSRVRSSPGGGTIRALVRLSERHEIRRFPRVQEFVSSGRLVQWAKASAGTRSGSSGTTMGHAALTRAFSEAAVLFLRNNPAGQKSLTRFARNHGTGTALTILAHPWARAV